MSAGASENPLRTIPAVHAVVDHPLLADWSARLPRAAVVAAVREVIESHRAELGAADGARAADGADGEGAHEAQAHSAGARAISAGELAERVARSLARTQSARLRRVVNATGIVIHTGLGRAPLAEEAVEALVEAARHPVPVELDLESGERGRRSVHVRDLLRALTGAESATVVNNNAAALLLVLSTFARGREVIVSRGELIEIGGSFRLPEVMAAGGARLHEVGTTNRTRLRDYADAIGAETAAIMKIHRSNFRIEGFTEEVPVRDLADLAHRSGVPLVHDIGSGALRPLDDAGLADEPDATTSIAAGADLVLFSGDKLLGGPQAGVIIGGARYVESVEKNPMMRALRVDKLTLAALAATLALHRDPATARARVPVLAMAGLTVEALLVRAEALAGRLAAIEGVRTACVEPCDSYLGGGSLPAKGVSSVAVEIEAALLGEAELARRLRMGEPAIVCRIHAGRVRFDLRTVRAEEDAEIVEAVSRALQTPLGR